MALSQLTWLLIENVLLPAIYGSLGGWMNVIFAIPLFGPWLKSKITGIVKDLYDKGVITLKYEILEGLADKAKIGYEPQIALLKEAQTREFLSEEEELEYEKRLKDSIRNHPGISLG